MENKYSIRDYYDVSKNRYIRNVKTEKGFTLFRYRSNHERSLKALQRNEIWGSTPHSFNDPYDSTFCVQQDLLLDYLRGIPSSLKKLFFTHSLPQTYTDDDINMCVLKLFVKQIEFFLSKLSLIASFSEKITNEVMWAHYASSAQGFAVEYYYNDLVDCTDSYLDYLRFGLKDSPKGKEILEIDTFDYSYIYNVFPVIYKDTKFDATEMLIEELDNSIQRYLLRMNDNKNNFDLDFEEMKKLVKQVSNYQSTTHKMHNSIYLKKSSLWSYESEWRMTVPNDNTNHGNNNENHKIIGTLKPKAVYIGESTKSSLKASILQYCQKNNITSYQMYSDIYAPNRLLKYKKITKEERVCFLKNYNQE